MTRTVSPAGRAAIMQREGVRLKAYRDSVGVLTIGVGHTGRMSGPKVTAGMVISTAKAEVFLASDLAPVEKAINGGVKVAVTQNQFDALASLTFNIGVGGFTGSSVLRRLNAGDVQGAAEAFLMWEKPAVLKARREAERRQFLTPDAESATFIFPASNEEEKMNVPAPAPCTRADCPFRAAAPIAPKPAPNPVREVLR